MTSENILEIKNVAAILNFKIIRLCFYLNVPLDAIAHFKKHIDIFQTKFIDKIEFEHYAWLAKQFSMFGELFDMAIGMFNLSPSSSQNPGTYFYESAMYTIQRRDSRLKNINLSLEEKDLINNVILNSKSKNEIEYIGQLSFLENESSK